MLRLTRCLIALGGVLVAGCGGQRSAEETHALVGSITVAGQPARDVMIVARGSDGKDYSGVSDATGKYQIDNPPIGTLRITLASATPPPPPGVKGAGASREPRYVPAGYSGTSADLTVEFTGGTQVFDIAAATDADPARSR
ncbi:unnamed protein product [Gemmataceae bacterium]|nr:unnamed protein product [Gemmataceae bacterium]VTT98388.1 unnamed protein product [Gemmataceae bacterium]